MHSFSETKILFSEFNLLIYVKVQIIELCVFILADRSMFDLRARIFNSINSQNINLKLNMIYFNLYVTNHSQI